MFKKYNPRKPLSSFVAIDFETANDVHSSVCAVGVAVVRDGVTVDTYYSLIHPRPNYYGFFNTRVHGLRKSDTENAPGFPVVWDEVSRRICQAFDVAALEEVMAAKTNKMHGIPWVAYNKQCDENCLCKVYAAYQMAYPGFVFTCAYKAALSAFKEQSQSFKLDAIAALCGYTMKHHHNALDDAIACAEIAKRIMCGAPVATPLVEGEHAESL